MNTVLFDDSCALCRTLATWVATRSGGAASGLTFKSWQSHYGDDTTPGVLRVLTADGELDGPAAWEFLLRQVPDLSSLNWLAQRLGISAGVARALDSAGHFSRRFCRTCGRKPWEQGAR
jgi:hypothetical protein